jgi:hypothetical protein
MNLLNGNIGKAELLAMMIFTTGCIVDHITTYYGLSVPTIEEANPVVLFMIGTGIWNAVDILIIVMGNSTGFILSGEKSRGIMTMLIVTLVVAGLVRMVAGVHNIMLVSNVGRVLGTASMGAI